MREFVLRRAPFPEHGLALMWFHPFNRTVLWMNFIHSQGFMENLGGAFLMKFFPLGFLLLFPKKGTLEIPPQVTRLDLLAAAHGDTDITERFRLRTILRSDWPEGPSGLEANFGGNTPGVVVTPRAGHYVLKA